MPSQVLTSRVDNESHFSKTLVVRFIGSMEVPQDRGDYYFFFQLLCFVIWLRAE